MQKPSAGRFLHVDPAGPDRRLPGRILSAAALQYLPHDDLVDVYPGYIGGPAKDFSDDKLAQLSS